jgi:hypothetical protein
MFGKAEDRRTDFSTHGNNYSGYVMSTDVQTPDAKNSADDTARRFRGLGIAGALLAAFSLLNALEGLISLSQIVKIISDRWTDFVKAFWNFLLSFVDLPTITSVDAVFLTFFSMMMVSIITSFRTGSHNPAGARRVFRYIAAIVGLIILVGLFTFGDMIAYDREVQLSGNHAFYKSSIQSYFYKYYIEMIHPETWVEAGPEAEYIRFALLFFFYFIVSLGIIIISSLIGFLFGLNVSIRNISLRIWLIVILVASMIGLNFGTLLFENGFNFNGIFKG